jgi:nucleoid-associated protein YgaU
VPSTNFQTTRAIAHLFLGTNVPILRARIPAPRTHFFISTGPQLHQVGSASKESRFNIHSSNVFMGVQELGIIGTAHSFHSLPRLH